MFLFLEPSLRIPDTNLLPGFSLVSCLHYQLDYSAGVVYALCLAIRMVFAHVFRSILFLFLFLHIYSVQVWPGISIEQITPVQ